jgi:predicted RNA-binding protein with PUA-like domain
MTVWLMKSEPEVFSFEDLKAAPDQATPWEGVRNFQARNFMRDAMRIGDTVLYYHSNCAEPGIVGLAEIASAPYPDPTQFDPSSDYHDPRSAPDNPRWMLVDVRFKEDLPRPVSLREIKAHPVLREMLVAQRGSRLSIQPVDQAHMDCLQKDFWS